MFFFVVLADFFFHEYNILKNILIIYLRLENFIMFFSFIVGVFFLSCCWCNKLNSYVCFFFSYARLSYHFAASEIKFGVMIRINHLTLFEFMFPGVSIIHYLSSQSQTICLYFFEIVTFVESQFKNMNRKNKKKLCHS